MNLRDLAEVACLVSWYGTSLRGEELDRDALETYWKSFRLRAQLWQRTLPACEPPATGRGSEFLEELLVSDLLTRVAATILYVSDPPASGKPRPLRKLALRTVAEHAAFKELSISLSRKGTASVAELLRLQRLQRRLDRWTDLLLSPYASLFGTTRFAVDAARCREFAGEAAFGLLPRSDSASLCLYSEALKLAVPNTGIGHPARGAAHRLLADAVLGLIPATVFEVHGRVKTRLQRLIETGSAAECRGMTWGDLKQLAE